MINYWITFKLEKGSWNFIRSKSIISNRSSQLQLFIFSGDNKRKNKIKDRGRIVYFNTKENLAISVRSWNRLFKNVELNYDFQYFQMIILKQIYGKWSSPSSDPLSSFASIGGKRNVRKVWQIVNRWILIELNDNKKILNNRESVDSEFHAVSIVDDGRVARSYSWLEVAPTVRVGRRHAGIRNRKFHYPKHTRGSVRAEGWIEVHARDGTE